MYFTCSECVSVAVFVQHAIRLRRNVLLAVTCVALPYFSHYLTNGVIFGKKVIEHEMCIWMFSTTSVRNISHSRKK